MWKKLILSIPVVMLTVGLIAAIAGFSDEPLPKPSTIIVWSCDRSKCAVSWPSVRVTAVCSVGKETGEKSRLWSMVGWFRVMDISNDGEHLVIGYDGADLLPLDYRPDEPMLYFVRKGELIKLVTLKEMIKDLSKMQRTVSHCAWGNYRGFNEKGQYILETCEGRRVCDPKTGKLTEGK